MGEYVAVRVAGMKTTTEEEDGGVAESVHVRRVSGKGATAPCVEVDMRMLEGTRAVASRRRSIRDMVAAAEGGGEGKEATGSTERLLVIRATRVTDDDGDGSGALNWVGRVEGEIVEEHSFVAPVDAAWPEGTAAWKPSLEEEIRAVGAGKRNTRVLPRVVPESLFGHAAANLKLRCDTTKKRPANESAPRPAKDTETAARTSGPSATMAARATRDDGGAKRFRANDQRDDDSHATRK